MKKILSFMLAFAMLMSLVVTGAGKTVVANAEENVKYFSVVFNENSIPADFQEQLAANGAEIVYEVPEIGYVQIKGNSNSVDFIKGLKTVQAIAPTVTWSMPETTRIKVEEELTEEALNTDEVYWWDRQWDIQRITDNGASYELGTGSHDVVVGIIDSGIDRDHPDLVGNLLPGSKNFVPEGGLRGQEPYETGDINAFDDLRGHGSHVAGSIAANGAMLGVAPNVGIKAYRVFGKGGADSSWIINAMIAAADDGVDVMSMSLGGFDILGQIFYIDPETGVKERLGDDVADYIAYKRAVQYVQSKGVLIVVASGNDGMNCTNRKEITEFLNAEYGPYGYKIVGASFNSPAQFPNVVTVSATGQNDVLAQYSNYGPGFIDIAAVGGDDRLYYEYLYSGRFAEYIANRIYYQEFCLSTGELGDYYYSVGTSMACPKVSAVAALLIDKYGKMAPNKLAQLLYKKAVDPVKGKNRAYFGYGHLNAYNALK